MAKVQHEEMITEEVDDSSPWGIDYPSEYNTVVDGKKTVFFFSLLWTITFCY